MSNPKILVDSVVLQQLIRAVMPNTPGHYLREIQATMSLNRKMKQPNAINDMVDCYNAWVKRGGLDESAGRPVEAEPEPEKEETSTEQPSLETSSGSLSGNREPNATVRMPSGSVYSLWIGTGNDSEHLHEEFRETLQKMHDSDSRGPGPSAVEVVSRLRQVFGFPFKVQVVSVSGTSVASSGFVDTKL